MSAPLVGARERQRAEAVAAICAGRPAVVVGPAGGEGARALPAADVVGLDAFVRDDGAAGAQAVVVLDPVPGRVLRRVATRLAERAAGGSTVVLAIEPGREALVAPALPGARVLRQVAHEVVALGSRPPGPVELPEAAPEGAVRVLLVAGGDAPAEDARVTATAVSEPYQAELLRELADLRAANARLRSTVRPIESAAAATVASGLARAARQVAELEGEIAALRARVEHEIEVAAFNDRLFQEARHVIALRDEEIGRLEAILARPHHRVVERAGARASQVPVVSGVLRRTLRKLP